MLDEDGYSEGLSRSAKAELIKGSFRPRSSESNLEENEFSEHLLNVEEPLLLTDRSLENSPQKESISQCYRRVK